MYPPQLPEPELNRLNPPLPRNQIKHTAAIWASCWFLLLVSYSAFRAYSLNTPTFSDYAPVVSYNLGYIIFYALLILSLGSFLSVLALGFALAAQIVQHLRKRNPSIMCPNCATRNSAKNYLEGRGCQNCGSMLVYCEKCGKAAEFKEFVWGTGCPSCGYRFFHTAAITPVTIDDLTPPI